MTPQERAERAAKYLNRAHERFERGTAQMTMGDYALLAQAEVALAGLERQLAEDGNLLSVLVNAAKDLTVADERDLFTERLGTRNRIRDIEADIARMPTSIPEHLLKRSREAREKADTE